MLRHDEAAVFFGLDDRKPDPLVAFHERPVGEVPACALRAALDDVAGDDSGGHAIPIVRRPAELEHHRRQRHGCVSYAPGDDDVGAALERLDDPCRTYVRVRRQHTRTNLGQRLAGVHIDERLARGQATGRAPDRDRRR